MKKTFLLLVVTALTTIGMLSCPPNSVAQEKSPTGSTTKKQEDVEQPAPIKVSVCDGKLQFTADGQWKSVEPKSRILEAELKVPAAKGDKKDGRLTIMGAGGSIEANIQRWEMQFKQPDGSPTKADVKGDKVDGQEINFVDITGTFMDSQGGPFSGLPKIERKDYRMMAAIVETKNNGNYFLKFYGPKTTVKKNVDAFKKMVKSMKTIDSN